MSITLKTDSIKMLSGQSFTDMKAVKEDLDTLRNEVEILGVELTKKTDEIKALIQAHNVDIDVEIEGVHSKVALLDKSVENLSHRAAKGVQEEVSTKQGIENLLGKTKTLFDEVKIISDSNKVVEKIALDNIKHTESLVKLINEAKSASAANEWKINRINENTFWNKVKRFFGRKK